MKTNILMQELEEEYSFRKNMTYSQQLQIAMNWLGKKPDTLFIGQAVEYPGTAMTNSLNGICAEKLLELPVAEELQMGMSLGLTFENVCPISIFPRWNFLLCGLNQLINHIDKKNEMLSVSSYPNVIIRTSVGSERPLNPQCQHVGDFSEAIKKMCRSIDVIQLTEPEQILPAYKLAYERKDSKATICVEYGDFHNEK